MSEYLPAYRAAQAAARELFTLHLVQDGLIAPDVEERLPELEATPHAIPALVELLVGAVADQWTSVEEFSGHILAALAEDDTQEEGR